MRLHAFVLLLGGITSCLAQTPIPYRVPGFIYQTSDNFSLPLIDIFYDHLCPDSRDNWPIMQKVLADTKVPALIHIFPLPYHHNAYFVQQAGVVIRAITPSSFVDYMELIFNNQDNFTTGAVDMTEPQVQLLIANAVGDQHYKGIDSAIILNGFEDPVTVTNARYAWKYGCSRGVSGTPFFMINGVIDPDAGGYSVDDWEKLIATLIAGPQ